MRPSPRSVAALAAATIAVLAGGGAVLDAGARMTRADALVRSSEHRGDPHNAIIAVHTNRPLVALSFDDGPDPRYTPRVLALLSASRAHATFFVVGERARAHPGLVRATLAAGNELGDHTLTHPLLPALPRAAIEREIAAGARAIEAAGAPAPRLFRPPHGYFDRRVSAAAARARLRTIGWDVVVERALARRSIATSLARLLREIHPGSIVLAHDGRLQRARTIAVLARLLPALRARGLRVVTVSALLAARER